MIRRFVLVFAVCAFFSSAASTRAHAHVETDATADSVRYEMVVHLETGIELPRIMLPERPDVEAAVNHALDSLAATMHCGTGDRSENDAVASYEAWSEVTHASDDILSVHIRASYFCGGPYSTDGANLSTTFDLRTGRAAPFQDLFVHYDADQDAITEIIVATLSEAQSDQASDAREDVCAAVCDAAQMRHFAYHIDAGDLIVEPMLPRVLQACGATAAVPIDSLRPFLEADGLLMRLQ